MKTKKYKKLQQQVPTKNKTKKITNKLVNEQPVESPPEEAPAAKKVRKFLGEGVVLTESSFLRLLKQREEEKEEIQRMKMERDEQRRIKREEKQRKKWNEVVWPRIQAREMLQKQTKGHLSVNVSPVAQRTGVDANAATAATNKGEKFVGLFVGKFCRRLVVRNHDTKCSKQ